MRTFDRHGSRLLALALALGLAGCGSDDRPAPPPPPPPAATTDAFIAYVQTTVATQSDTDEPAATDGVNATAPETSEPEPVN